MTLAVLISDGPQTMLDQPSVGGNDALAFLREGFLRVRSCSEMLSAISISVMSAKSRPKMTAASSDQTLLREPERTVFPFGMRPGKTAMPPDE